MFQTAPIGRRLSFRNSPGKRRYKFKNAKRELLGPFLQIIFGHLLVGADANSKSSKSQIKTPKSKIP
jgi:hypothetical protein